MSAGELLLNRSKNVVLLVQLCVFEQRHLPLHESNSHRISHSDRMVTLVINQRVAIVAFAATQRIRMNLESGYSQFLFPQVISYLDNGR